MKLRILVLFILAVACDRRQHGWTDRFGPRQDGYGQPLLRPRERGIPAFQCRRLCDWRHRLTVQLVVLVSKPQGTLGNFTVDLGQVDVVTGIALEDTHNRGYYDRGTQNFTVGLSTDDVHFTTVWTGAFTQSDWENLNTISQSISPTACNMFSSMRTPFGVEVVADLTKSMFMAMPRLFLNHPL